VKPVWKWKKPEKSATTQRAMSGVLESLMGAELYFGYLTLIRPFVARSKLAQVAIHGRGNEYELASTNFVSDDQSCLSVLGGKWLPKQGPKI
jgi:hypothetical protein